MANKKTKKTNKAVELWQKIKPYVKLAVAIIAGLILGTTVTVAVQPDGTTKITTETIIADDEGTIQIADTQVEAVITDENGNDVVVDDIATVEAVDGGEITTTECDEGQDCGQGAYYDTTTADAYLNATYGKCIDVDGAYGAQCFDFASNFWINYAGRYLSTCGTGAAKGTWNCKEQNAGDEFELITDPAQIQKGDIVVTSTGKYGHIGMAVGSYNNGYVVLQSNNQGGASCSGGGAAANRINLNLKDFVGAFRPKAYIIVEPEPEPEVVEAEPTNTCETWTVKRGDTIGGIMVQCLGGVDWENDEQINEYANRWVSKVVRDGQTVFEGWNSETGVGLYAGDTIIFNAQN